MMNKIDNSGQGLAKLGRDEDQYMAHVAQGEMVVPPIISPETRARIEAEMKAVGLSPDEYTVGAGMSINPITGMPEFGWLKKTFKSVKKVVKKAAPVIGVASMLIPGVGPAISGALGSLGGTVVSGLSKIPGIGGALSSGASAIGRGIGALTGIGGGTAGTAADTGGNIFSRIKSGIGSYFNPAEGTKGIFGGTIGPGLRRGIGSLFGGGMGDTVVQQGDTLTSIAQKAGVSVQDLIAANPQITDPNLIQAGMQINIPGAGGGFLSNILGPGQGSIADYDPTTGKGQSRLGLIEDLIKGTGGKVSEGIGSIFGGGSQQPGGGMFGGNMGAAAMAGLLGKAAYDAAKERKGGLAATPAVMMDELGRYQLSKELGTGGTRGEFGLGPAPKALEFAGGGLASTRQYFNMGGVAELDMRDGGESAGPGTGTSDDIPAMLSDGEYVMTAKATRGAGAFNVKKNKSGIELVTGGSASREKGVKNMRELMNIFEAI
jgi:hypothetical protein